MLGLQTQTEKQERYEKSRAYDVINALKRKNLSSSEIIACINVMSTSVDNSETQQEVLTKAKNIVMTLAESEMLYETRSFIPIASNVD